MNKVGKKSKKEKTMNADDQQKIKDHLKEIAEIIYKNTEESELESFESIELSLRSQMLTEIGLEIAKFFFRKNQELKREETEP
jgi:hypothetical protein